MICRAGIVLALVALSSCTQGSSGASPTETPSATAVDGRWNWVCCNERFRGTMTLKQSGGSVTGSIDGFPEDGSTDLAGTVEGITVRLTRTLPVGKQAMHLVVDASGKAMRGRFEGPHDPAFATDIVAQRVGSSPEPP